MFNPLSLILVALSSALILGEEIRTGTYGSYGLLVFFVCQNFVTLRQKCQSNTLLELKFVQLVGDGYDHSWAVLIFVG